MIISDIAGNAQLVGEVDEFWADLSGGPCACQDSVGPGSPVEGRRVVIVDTKRAASPTNKIAFTPQNGQIDGNPSKEWTTPGVVVTLTYRGGTWQSRSSVSS